MLPQVQRLVTWHAGVQPGSVDHRSVQPELRIPGGRHEVNGPVRRLGPITAEVAGSNLGLKLEQFKDRRGVLPVVPAGDNHGLVYGGVDDGYFF